MDQDLEQRKEEEEEDVISLCDLSTDHYQESESDTPHQDYEDDANFDFSFINPLSNTSQNDMVLDNDKNGINFCGKIIGYNNNKYDDDDDASYIKQQENVNAVDNLRRLKKSGSSQSQTSQATGSNRYRYPSSKCSFRKHTALIGLVKIPTEMELSDIRNRQSKRRKPMLPVTAVGDPAVAGDNGSGGNESASERGRNNRWGLVRSLRCGARFANVFTKTAFGCFSFSLVRV